MAASSDRDSADQAGGDRVSMASAGVPRVRRDDARALACRGSQWHLWSPGAGDGRVVYGGVSLVQAHDAAGDGRGVRRADECGDDQPVGAGHDSSGRCARRGSPYLRARASRGPPRRDELASRGQAGVVMGGGDELG